MDVTGKCLSEPGFCRGNEDSRGNENQKSREKKIFRMKTN